MHTRVLAAEGSLGSAAVGSVSGRGETKVYGTWEAEANNNDAAHLRMPAQAAQSHPAVYSIASNTVPVLSMSPSGCLHRVYALMQRRAVP